MGDVRNYGRRGLTGTLIEGSSDLKHSNLGKTGDAPPVTEFEMWTVLSSPGCFHLGIVLNTELPVSAREMVTYRRRSAYDWRARLSLE
jgi:hypothetical protein